jgi:hypothetical protein
MNNDEIYNAIVDLKIQIGTYRAETTAQNTVTNAQLISINKHLNTLNGRVGKVEKDIIPLNNHLENTSDYDEKIRAIEDNLLSVKSVKKWLVGLVVIMSTIMSIIFILLKIFQNAG